LRKEQIMDQPKFRSIAPILQIADLDRAVDFWKRVMAFDVAWIAGGEPATIASFCRDQIYLMARVEKKPLPCGIYLELDGVDAYFERVRSAGAKVVHGLADREYGMRDGRVEDPDGNQISLGEPLPKN
jgi:predicted enzyme related to lactoylglutathione lyase